MIAGALTIELNANLARLSDDIRKATGIVGGGMRNIESTVASAKNALGMLGVGVGFGALVAGFKSVIDSAAALDDMSEKTGAAVAELSKLEQVARIGGHSLETAETALIRLTKALHGGDEEAKGAGKALAALGLQADALRNKDTAEALRIVAGELNKYADGSGKTALALDLLGKSGAQALPFLKDLATEGGISSRVTAEMAAGAEEAQKQIKRLANEMHHASQVMALSAVPAMNDWIAANREAIRIAGSAGEAARLFVFNVDAMTSEKPREEIERLTAALKKFQDAGPIGKFLQSPTGAVFGGRESDLKKQIELLHFLERQEALAGRTGPQFLDARDLRAMQKPLLDYAKFAAADPDSAYRSLLKTLKEKLLVDGELTEMAKLQLSLEALAAKQRATIGPMREEELKALAAQVDANKQLKTTMENNAKNFSESEAHREQVAKELAAEDKSRFDAIAAGYKHAEQIEFETKLIGLSNEAREIAIALRDIETSGIKRSDEAYAGLAERIRAALAEKTLVESNKKAADEITEFWKAAAQSMQQSMSGFFFDIMQGNLKDLSSSFKRTIDKIVSDMLAAQAATKLFGPDFGKGGDIGGLVGKGIDWLKGLGGGGSIAGMSSGEFGAAVLGGVSYASGTDYVPRTGMYTLHEGEAVVPAAENTGDGRRTLTVHNVFNVSGAVDRRSRQQIAAEAAQAIQLAHRNL